jgi:hypothetical protein
VPYFYSLILATDTDDGISIADAARLVAVAMGFNGDILFDGTKAAIPKDVLN